MAILHPLPLGGPARRWWLTARLSGIATNLAMVGVLAWIAAGGVAIVVGATPNSPACLVGALGGMMLGYYGASIADRAAWLRYQRRGDLLMAAGLLGPVVWCLAGRTPMEQELAFLVAGYRAARQASVTGVRGLDRFFDRLNGAGQKPRRPNSNPA